MNQNDYALTQHLTDCENLTVHQSPKVVKMSERKYTDRSNLTTISEGLESLPASPEQLFLSRTWSTIHKDVADEFKTAVVNTLRFIDLESSGMDMYQ